ncbi:alkaline phosphatase PafA [Flagellimonas sp.]|uniref:alkaline phosphatase PafA n=1 Tax=Flagellimonas sp. TaxID=2058762 RepID=UPI003AB6936A
MIKTRSLGWLLLIFFICSSSIGQRTNSRLERPKLVVGIVVDQMRWDYLYRYYDRYGEEGFKRMLNQGFSAENTYINYVPTVTGIGHTSIFTGSVPSIHGIAGNHFIDEETKEEVYCVEDGNVDPIGSLSKAAQMSPHRLLTTTLGDELRLATNYRAKVIGIALKDRSAILSAGRSANAAYWYDIDARKWVTSSWYSQSLPDWLEAENNQGRLELLAKAGWKTLYPMDTYVQSTADAVPYEGALAGLTSATFPLDAQALLDNEGAEPLLNTYLGNELTLSMAKLVIDKEELGKDAITDMLTLSFSSTDWVGHRFGPNSVEAEDTYLRLDGQLADLFHYLDNKVGEGAYTVFLSADHGAAHNVNFLKDHKLSAGGWDIQRTLESLNQHLSTTFSVQGLVSSLLYYQVHFNEPLIEKKELNRADIVRETTHFLRKLKGVQYVVPMEEVNETSVPNIIGQRIINGYHHKRSGCIQIIVEPAWYYQRKVPLQGTDHSSWNPYDSHIPLLFMGWGIKKGTTHTSYNMTDIAPTISALLKIQEPNGNIGRPINQVFE